MNPGDNFNENARLNTYTPNVVYVVNIPFCMTKEDLATLFKLKVGGVSKVFIFTRAKLSVGRGLVEFFKDSSAQKAIKKMNMYYVYGQHLTVKRDNGKGAYWLNKHLAKCYIGNRAGEFQENDSIQSCDYFDAYGANQNIIATYNMSTLAVNKIFIGNLNFNVEKNKLIEVFSIAGEIVETEVFLKNNGRNRGFAKITYNHPLEAVQAISMFHDQFLYGRPMIVRFNNTSSQVPMLPLGLEGIGNGLGPGGAVLNIKECLPKSYSLPPPANIMGSEMNAVQPQQMCYATAAHGYIDESIMKEIDNIIGSYDSVAGASSTNMY